MAMPSSFVKALAGKTGKSRKDVEKAWERAKVIVKQQYDDVEKHYGVVAHIAKKILKKEAVLVGVSNGRHSQALR